MNLTPSAAGVFVFRFGYLISTARSVRPPRMVLEVRAPPCGSCRSSMRVVEHALLSAQSRSGYYSSAALL